MSKLGFFFKVFDVFYQYSVAFLSIEFMINPTILKSII